MQRIYTHENRLLVSHAKNILDSADIKNLLKNEFAAGAMGDIAPLDTWMELWIVDERDQEKAAHLLEKLGDTTNHGDTFWGCSHCQETNPSNFVHCWHCQQPISD